MGTNERLVVLGAGWLGKPLCEKAQQLNWQVQGSRRHVDDNCDYQRLLEYVDDTLHHGLDLHNAWWVCCLPPRSRDKQSNYLTILEACLKLAKKLSAKGFLLCSSTGVYNPQDGIYKEDAAIECQSDRQQLLYDAEQLVLAENGKVVRLAGLVGPGREPGRFVAGKVLQSSSQQTVNMVQQQDVIAAMFAILNNWSAAKDIYNIVNPAHPTKKAYYQQKCQQYGNEMPKFSSDDNAQRIIDGSAIETLGFHYQHDI